jgi:hypothetical protein
MAFEEMSGHPMIDLVFLIHDCISESSLTSGVMMDPRYLKLGEKLILSFLCSSTMSLGMVTLSSSFFASARVGGKYIAWVFDLLSHFQRAR